jgi:hypothetical protein
MTTGRINQVTQDNYLFYATHYNNEAMTRAGFTLTNDFRLTPPLLVVVVVKTGDITAKNSPFYHQPLISVAITRVASTFNPLKAKQHTVVYNEIIAKRFVIPTTIRPFKKPRIY